MQRQGGGGPDEVMETGDDCGREVQSARICRGLARIRAKRRLFLAILFSFPLVILLVMAWIRHSGNWLPIAIPGFLFFFGMLVQHRLHRSRCPRCGDFFFVQTVTKDNYTPESSISFPPQKHCRNCDLGLYE